MTIAHPARRLVMLLAVVALAAPAAASAQAHVSIQLGLPAILPPLVVIEPGVQVVQDFGEEVFFVDGCYWARRDGWWYRAHDHRARWTWVEPRWVPAALVRIPPGRYRHWHAEYRHPQWQHEHRPAPWQHAGPHRQWPQEHGHRSWQERGNGPLHGKGAGREWREARWDPAGQHRQGRGHR